MVTSPAARGVVTPAMQEDDGSTLRPDITVGNGATLSTRGLWVNDGGLAADQRSGDRYINGGSIGLAASIAHDAANQDLSGSVLLQAGSTLDVSGGGYVQPDRQVLMANGVPAGHGGDISLVTYGNASTQEQQPDRLDGAGPLRRLFDHQHRSQISFRFQRISRRRCGR